VVSSRSEHDARCTAGKTKKATNGAALDDGAVEKNGFVSMA
jgi:hypothetical protein